MPQGIVVALLKDGRETRMALCCLCVLCVSVVNVFDRFFHHRDTENTEMAQRGTATTIVRTKLVKTKVTADE